MSDSSITEFEIYKGKTFSSLCKEIVVNQQNKKDQLDLLVSDLKKLIKTTNDAMVIVPLMKDYFDVGVRNDEQLIKLAQVIQRILSKSSDSNDANSSILTDEEKAEIMKNIEAMSIAGNVDKK